MYRYFKLIAGVSNSNYIYYWESKGSSDERINSIRTSNHSITPGLNYYGNKTRVEFFGSCLKQDKVAFNHGKVVNIYIVYELDASSSLNDDPTLKTLLFRAVRLTKNADIQISTSIQVVELDLIENQVFHFRVVDLFKM